MATFKSSLIYVIAALTVGCAYHNPTAPTPPADDLGAPTTLTIGTLPGSGARTVITAHVLNLRGAPLTNMIVQFTTSFGTISPDVANTGADGTAATTLTAADTARVTVTVGPLHTQTLVAAPNGSATPPPTTPTVGVFLNVVASALTGSPVTFSVSSPAIGPWAWSFGDGGSDQTTAFSTTHTYGRSGVYVASVSGVGTASASATITVADPAPPPTTPAAALAATMTCTPGVHAAAATPTACNVRVAYGGVALPGAAITNVGWDWSDGQTDSSAAPVKTHVYASPGVYTVFATVTATTMDGTKTATTTATSGAVQ